MHVFSATSVKFIMQMTNGKGLLNNDAARIFAVYVFSLGIITSALLVCDVVTSGNVEKWIMGKTSHEKLVIIINKHLF